MRETRKGRLTEIKSLPNSCQEKLGYVTPIMCDLECASAAVPIYVRLRKWIRSSMKICGHLASTDVEARTYRIKWRWCSRADCEVSNHDIVSFSLELVFWESCQDCCFLTIDWLGTSILTLLVSFGGWRSTMLKTGVPKHFPSLCPPILFTSKICSNEFDLRYRRPLAMGLSIKLKVNHEPDVPFWSVNNTELAGRWSAAASWGISNINRSKQ